MFNEFCYENDRLTLCFHFHAFPGCWWVFFLFVFLKEVIKLHQQLVPVKRERQRRMETAKSKNRQKPQLLQGLIHTINPLFFMLDLTPRNETWLINGLIHTLFKSK